MWGLRSSSGLVLIAALLVANASASRTEVSFDGGWLFHRGLCPRDAAQGELATGDPCAAPTYDDSSWRLLSVPHDWSREDLPARDVDTEYPVVGARYGQWKLKAGDNASWAQPPWDDSDWKAAAGGMDWRAYGHEFQAVNATGWYRQQLPASSIPAWMLNSTRPVTLSLGIVAGADKTYLNGQLLGTTPLAASGRHPSPGGETLSVREYVTARAYVIPPGLLASSEGNVLAVRVVSYGGVGEGPANATNYTDGDSFPPYGTTFPGGFYDDPVFVHHDKRVGPFDAAVSPGTMGTGYTLGGTGYYRKHFTTSCGASQRMFVRFDGVYMNSTVWLNGAHLGDHPYGYTTFEYELTKHLAGPNDGSNILAVRVSNLGRNSRFYSGSGIFRHVWLTCVDPVHIPLWGASIATPSVEVKSFTAAYAATVQATIIVENAGTTHADATVTVHILKPDGNLGGSATAKASGIRPLANTTVATNITLTGDVALWSTDTPALHSANIKISSAGSEDELLIPFGIRQISFNSSRGFVLNGVETKMYGGCVHHDNGPLGSMSIDRAEERRVEILKSHGYNAIRTSHNPVSPAFLDACDRLGMLVMNEAFDCWAEGKNPQDYHLFFNDWWRRDLAALVLRDRNHPSVVMWSIGNEIPMRFTRSGGNLSSIMVEMVHSMNPGSGRAVTSAYPLIHEQDSTFLHNLDVAGYNYAGLNVYESDHKRLPNRTFVGTESFAEASSTMWSQVWAMPSVIGDFIWTAVDYLGDDYVGSESGDVDYLSGRHPWPFHISFCGDFDITLAPKPQSVYRRVLWGVLPMGILVHGPVAHPELPVPWTPNAFNWNWPMELDSWTWPSSEGMNVGVRVFARGCESARLTLNGEKLGESRFNLSNLTATFVVPFASGKLEALCINESQIVPNISASLTTAGSATKLRLSADRSFLRAGDPNDLSYVTIEVLDNAGVTVPTAAVPVNLSLSLTSLEWSDAQEYSGAGTDGLDYESPRSAAAAAAAAAAVLSIEAVGSGDPSDPSSFTSSNRTTWRGRAIAVLRPLALTSPSPSPSPAGRGDYYVDADTDCTAWKEVEVTAASAGLVPGKLKLNLCHPRF